MLYIKSTATGATGSSIIINTEGKLAFMNAVAILLCFVPEGVTYYPFKNRKGLPSIHFNPISFDYFKKTNIYDEQYYIASELGAGVTAYKFKHSLLEFYGSIRYQYQNYTSPFFLNFGLSYNYIGTWKRNENQLF